ncbi:hypothetical protein [Loktanella gaetbuli]|uniref:hypothetical protein n=1 Tax=Loktanella gaetbuli TaxID=2881335 RepID=UPI00299DBF9B|nr:hypothetical protein [Loktanella gaetbuli]
MIRSVLCLTALVATAACAPRVPDSGAAAVMASQRAAQQAQAPATFSAPSAVAAAPLGADNQAVASSELAALGIGAGAAAAPEQVGPPLSAVRVQQVASNNAALSDENSFDAVASRETIESDAQRRAQLAAQRQVVMPTAVPNRPADTGPNIVEYALSAPNRKGQEWYSRSVFASQRTFERNCAEYNSPDAAQRDFLARGGPERNARGLDPDGDGFACGWDPAPFRLVATGN